MTVFLCLFGIWHLFGFLRRLFMQILKARGISAAKMEFSLCAIMHPMVTTPQNNINSYFYSIQSLRYFLYDLFQSVYFIKNVTCSNTLYQVKAKLCFAGQCLNIMLAMVTMFTTEQGYSLLMSCTNRGSGITYQVTFNTFIKSFLLL